MTFWTVLVIVTAEKLPKNFFAVDEGKAVNLSVVFRVFATKVLMLQLLTLTALINKTRVYRYFIFSVN